MPHDPEGHVAETTYDTLSHVLRSVRFRAAVFYDVRGGRAWSGEGLLRATSPPQ